MLMCPCVFSQCFDGLTCPLLIVSLIGTWREKLLRTCLACSKAKQRRSWAEERRQEGLKGQQMLMTESGRWRQRATMQCAARNGSRPGVQRGLQLPSKLPRRGMAPEHTITWKGLQTGATQMTGKLMVLSFPVS